jgi:EmrB/QacA subfamily drug resistance transporter
VSAGGGPDTQGGTGAGERSSAAAGANHGHVPVLALAAMALGVFVIANDFTALSVALPKIESDLGTDLTTVQWIINAYALVFGVLIVTGGRLADLFGRKRVFLIGSAIFAAFSLLGGIAPNVELVILCRALMGVGGAMMWPAVLGMTYAILPDDKAGLAGGLILGVAGFGNAVGPLLGGFLTDALSWRWLFFVNVPIALVAMFVTWREVDESAVDSAERRIDYWGVATLSIAVVSILLALDEGTDAGFTSPGILGLFATAIVFFVAFALIERRQGVAALVPNDVLRNKVFVAACGAVLLMSAIFFSALLYLPQFFAKDLGYSAVKSGAGLLPMMGVFAATSFVAGSLYERLGAKVIVTAGAALLGIGIFMLSFIETDSSYGSLVAGMVVLGVGVGLFYSSITTSAVTALDPSRSSLAGGIVYMCQIAGGAVGLGLNTAIVASASNLAEGISLAFRVDAGLAVVGTLVALMFVGGTRPTTGHARHLRVHHRAHA